MPKLYVLAIEYNKKGHIYKVDKNILKSIIKIVYKWFLFLVKGVIL